MVNPFKKECYLDCDFRGIFVPSIVRFFGICRKGDLMKTYSSGWYVDEETGESYYLPADTTIRTKEDGKRIREMVAKREEYEAARQVANTFTTNLCGEFFWSLYDVGQDYHPSISDDLLAKIIYLLTYLDYKKNMLVIRGSASEQYRPMKKEDVRNIIRLHRCKFPRFWESLLGSGIISENTQGELIVCDSFCRCKVDRRSVNGMSKIKMYSRAIRYVYENTDVRSHKYLSYLYRLIPYINLKYNILCLNPLETDKYKVRPLTTKELCGLIGIAGRKDNEERLTEKLFKLMFKIATTRTGWGDKPIEEQKIESIVIDTKGVTYPEPEKLPR